MKKHAAFAAVLFSVFAIGISKAQAAGPFLKINAGYDYAFLGDVVNGTKAIGKAAYDLFGGNETTSPSNSGIATGLEFGLMFDAQNSISLDTSFVLGFGSKTAVDGGPVFEQNTTPNMLGATLNYNLLLPLGAGNNLVLSAGAGWYHAMVDYLWSPVSGESVSGSFSGDAFGAVLGITESIELGGGLALDITAKGRWAAFDKVTAADLSETIPVFLGGGPYTLTMQDPDGDGQMNLLWDSEANVDGSTIRYAVVDMSGIQGLISLKLSL